MKLHSLTITLTDAQYQMLVAHAHYTNYLRELGIGYPDPSSPALLATDILVNHVNQSRERSRREFAARFKALDDRKRELDDLLSQEHGEPGMYDDIHDMIEANDAALRDLEAEQAAFNGPRPTPTP